MDKKKLLWFFVFIILVVLTIYTMVSTSRSFSFEGFVTYLLNANPFWIAMAVFCMLMYILLEGISIKQITDFLGTRITVKKGFLYSAADIFFSAITPSATGGQPASAFFMMRDGISASVTAISLLINISLYTVSIVLTCFVSIIINPGMFAEFETFTKVLVILGFVIQITCVTTFLMIVYKDKILFKIADKLLVVAKKLHLTKKITKTRKKLEKASVEYKECSKAVQNGFGMLVRVLLLNVLQRVSQIGVTVCVFLATGGEYRQIIEVFTIQSCVILGSNAVPIPGAVGVADLLFLDGFDSIVSVDNLLNIELLSRGISFYGCILLCIIIVAACYLAGLKKERKGKASG